MGMVITLGLMLGLRGVAQVLCGGRDIYFNKLGPTGEQLAQWGSYKIGGVLPVQVIPIVLSVAFAWVLVEKTVLGRQIQAVGDSPKSSRLAGIRTVSTLMFVYGVSALLAAFAGVFQSAKVMRWQGEMRPALPHGNRSQTAAPVQTTDAAVFLFVGVPGLKCGWPAETAPAETGAGTRRR